MRHVLIKRRPLKILKSKSIWTNTLRDYTKRNINRTDHERTQKTDTVEYKSFCKSFESIMKKFIKITREGKETSEI